MPIPSRPQEDPLFDSPEMREILWALDFEASRGVSSERAAALWKAIRRRVGAPPTNPAGIFRGLQDELVKGLRAVAATLVPEALVPSPAVRSTDTARPRLLVYETDLFAISLSFSRQPGAGGLRLLGQILPKTGPEIPPGGRVALWSEADTAFGEVDEHGEFVLESVARGELHMDILLGSDIIQLSPVPTLASGAEEE